MTEVYILQSLIHSLISFKTHSTSIYSVLPEPGWAMLGTREIAT